MASQDQNHLQQLLTDLRAKCEDSEPVGMKLRRLNEFVAKLSCKSCDADVDAILATIPNTPNDYFVKRIKLELANKLKRPAPVIEALQSEQVLLVNRALQIRWIYDMKDSNNSLTDPESLLKEIFPNVSYVCRKRIIHNLGLYLKDSNKVEKIFQAVENKYGLSSAVTLLPSCGKDFIENTLQNNKTLRFSSKQLSHILNREPEVAVKYLQNYFERLLTDRAANHYICSTIYSPTLAKLAKTKPQEFLRLYEKYSDIIDDLSFGPRITKLLLDTDKAAIINSAEKYVKLLNPAKILKRLSENEFQKFIIALFPKSVNSFQLAFEIGKRGHRGAKSKECIHSWLEHLPPKKQVEILDTCFEKVYSKNLASFPEFYTSRIIKLLETEEREKWVELKMNSADGPYSFSLYGKVPNHREGFWTAFRSTHNSIPKLKEFLVNESDVHRRGDLVSFLVYSCALNNDMPTLAEVCKFFVSRYRNDQVQVRAEFLETIDKRCDHTKLGEDHWQALNELLQLSSLNNEFSHYTSTMESILEKSIHYRLLHNLPIEPQIQHLIKIKTRSYCWGESWNILRKNSKFEKICLLTFQEQLTVIYPAGVPFPSNSSLTSAIISMAESMASWNSRHRNDPISASSFPWLLARLKDILESDHGINKSRVSAALYGDIAWRDQYFDNFTKCSPSPPILTYFLKKNPDKIKENMESILSFMIHSKVTVYGKFLRKIRSQGILGLKEQFVTKALVLMHENFGGSDDEYPMARGNAIRILSFLMKADDFIKKISRFYPDEPKIDMSVDDCGLKFETRKAVAASLKNVETPSSTFTSLFRFCLGDYLKLAVGSLYSICYNTPESKVLVFLKELVDRPVSVKKHAIRLVFTISHKEDIASFLNSLWEAEKNPSIRHIIFSRIFQFFLSEPSNDNWGLLKSSLLSLTTQDRDCLGELRDPSNVDSIPPEFLSEYFQSCWDILSNNSIMSYDTEWVKVNLLQRITPYNINVLSKEFLNELISSQLFLLAETDANLQTNMISLAVRYLLYSPDFEIQSSRLTIVVEALKRLTGPLWHTTDEEIHTLYPARQVFSSFIEQLCTQSFQKGPLQMNIDIDVANGNAIPLNSNANSRSLFKSLLDTLETLIEPADVFTEYLFLQFAIICNLDKDVLPQENGDYLFEELVQVGKQVGVLVDETVGIYKPEIIGLFSDTLKRFVNTCYKYRLTEFDGDGGRVIHLVDGILHSTGSVDTKIVAAQLIPATYPKAHNLEQKYTDVVNELRNLKEKSIRIFVNHRLTQSRPPEFYGLFD